MKVNKLSSTKTQLPYDYYSLPFCKPATIVNSAENLGEARPARAPAARARAAHAPRRHAGAARRPHRKQRVHGASFLAARKLSNARQRTPLPVCFALTRRVAAQLSMRVDEFCSASCVLGPLSEEVAAAFRAKIDDEYRVNMCAPLVPLPPAPAPGLACRLIAAIYAR